MRFELVADGSVVFTLSEKPSTERDGSLQHPEKKQWIPARLRPSRNLIIQGP